MDGITMKTKSNNAKAVGIITLVLVSICLCGCQEQDVGSQFEGIRLQSDVVKLVDAALSFNTDYEFVNETDEYPTEVIKSVDVKYLFQNIANKDISVSVQAYLYDRNNELIAICPENTHRVVTLAKDSSEKTYTPANTITYSKANVTAVDHAIIFATEVIS
jgi:hypothetical protein